jgi:hypothetical protein
MPFKIGLSTSHGVTFNDRFTDWTLDRIAPLEFDRFELCTEGFGLERAYQYRVLPKLNEFKEFRPTLAAELRRVLGKAKAQRREVVVWTHELRAPREILAAYPELRTRRGDLNLAHPLMTEFLAHKYDLLFNTVPEIDGVVLTVTEVAFPVAHRFDNAWAPDECLHWLFRTVYEACKRRGRKLIVRPFSAIVADYEAARRALDRLPADIEVMDKSDPFDWDPFLPLNPELKTYPLDRLTVEFDLGGEYFGRGAFPLTFGPYVKERLDLARRLGAQRIVGRLDRRGVSSLDREARINIEFFLAYAADPSLDVAAFSARRAGELYSSSDPAELAALFEQSFEVVKRMFYVDGQLLFHSTFGTLPHGQRNVIFETLRPGQPLDHCAGEWPILADRTTPLVGAARREKEEAVALAEHIRRRLAAIAPQEPALQERAESLVLVARLYRAACAAVQEYILNVANPGPAPAFTAACDALDLEVAALARARGPEWLANVPKAATEFASELRRVFALEQRVYQELPGLPPAERARVEDIVAAGYPAEGHRLSKFTHGSGTEHGESRCIRKVGIHVKYTLASTPGPKRLRVECAGSGRVRVLSGAAALVDREWSRGAEWGMEEVAFENPGAALDVRFDRVSDDTPMVRMVYLLKNG